jgi:hypothetical protein
VETFSWHAFILAFAGTVAAIGIAWLTARVVPSNNKIIPIAFGILPILIYLVVAGLIGEFEGFGIKAKFAQAVNSPIPSQAKILELPALSYATSDNALRQLEGVNLVQDSLLQGCRSVYILDSEKMQVKEISDLRSQIAVIKIAMALRSSILCGRFKALIAVDKRGKVLGVFERELFLELIAIPIENYNLSRLNQPKEEELAREIMASELGPILRTPAERAETTQTVYLGPKDSLLDALKILKENKTSVAVITDQSGRLLGVIDRTSVVDTLLELFFGHDHENDKLNKRSPPLGAGLLGR